MLTNEYPNISVASKSKKYLVTEYICLKMFEYLNYFNVYNVKIKIKSTNECVNIFAALKSKEYIFTNEYICQ